MNETNNKNYLPIAIIIAALVIGGAIVFTTAYKKPTTGNVAANPTGQPSQPENQPIVEFSITDDDHVRGNKDALVTIVEFSDFQCPFCSRFHPTVQQALNDYPDQVSWVYKHFPLDFHPEATPAAEASECAAEQGKFWEFSDELFAGQANLSKSFYEQTAQELGLNTEQFNECVSSRKYKNHVEQDYQEGISKGVTGTPGSFVNGQLVSGAVPFSTLETIIKSELQK